MTEALTMLAVSILAGYKVVPECQVREPFEWTGELLAMAVALTIGLVAATGVWVADWIPDVYPFTGPAPKFDVVPANYFAGWLEA